MIFLTELGGYMKKLLVVALSMFFTAGIFAGDAAYFVDEGFSSDGSVYVFGQYGKTDRTFNSYAEIFTVDVAKNDFVSDGIFRTLPGKAPANESGLKTYEKLEQRSAFYLKKYNLKKTNAENLLYVCDDESKKGTETIEFTDFELSTLEKPVKWLIKLIPSFYGSGQNLASSFYISIKEIDPAGQLLNEYKVGSPDVKRKNITDYKIEKIIRDESRKNIVFIVEKTLEDRDGVSFRYMVETFSVR